MSTGLCLDKSKLACTVLERNGFVAMQGDLNNRSDRIAFHQAAGGKASLLAAGFPCQPFSTQGDRAGMQDARSNTLLQVLRLAWHMQVPGLVLECVAAVQDFPEAMQAIQQLAHKLDFSFDHVVLELADQWPCKRRRWWGVLLPKLEHQLHLSAWPLSTAHPCIKDVIPEWPCWPAEQIHDLEWTQQEAEMYDDVQFGTDCRRYDANGVAPTALHSYGCALRPCPCGCRTLPLSLQRLMNGGLRGIGVVDVSTSQLRFAHPSELGLLNTLPVDFCYADSARDSLCLVGQVAAPLQALWVFAHVAVWNRANYQSSVELQPLAVVAQFKQTLLHQRQDLWLTKAMLEGLPVQVEVDGHACFFPATGRLTAGKLCAAEQHLHGPGHKIEVFHGDRRLPMQALLHPNEPGYRLSISAKRQKREPAPVDCYVCTETEILVSVVPTGTLLGQLPCLSTLDCSVLHLMPEQTPITTAFRVDAPCLIDAREMCAVPQSPEFLGDLGIAHLLRELAGRTVASDVLVLEPRFASLLGLLASVDGHSLLRDPVPQQVSTVVAVAASSAHWYVLLLSKEDQGVCATILDPLPNRSHIAGAKLAQDLCDHWHQPLCLVEQASWINCPVVSCGAAALAHVMLFLGLTEEVTPQLMQDLQERACWFQGERALHVGAGLSDLHKAQLTTLLSERGVPKDVAPARVDAAVKQLGANRLAEALQARNPWAVLKALGSQPGTNFKWVKSDELEQHIKERAGAKFGADATSLSVKRGKARGKGAPKAPPQLEPCSLQLGSNIFVDSEGEAVPVLAFKDVTSYARGVAICTPAEAAPYLSPYRSISVETLAIVTTMQLPATQLEEAQTRTIRFPVQYVPTGEAILMVGTLIQLGDCPVELAQATIEEVEEVHTGVMKVQVYKDQFPGSWDQFISAPIKAVMLHEPLLVLCKGQRCGPQCQKYHPPLEDAPDAVILDIWARRFQNLAGNKCEAGKAEVFQAFIRVPEAAVDSLQQVDKPGLYLEPRAPQGQPGAHPAYEVIWLPGADFHTATHALRTCDHALAIIRLGTKYGIRVREQYAEAAFKELRPDHIFQKVRVLLKHRLHPLPFGITRQGVAKLLEQWQWHARPLQPCRGDSQGAAWEIGSEQPPPSMALSVSSGFALACKIKDFAAPASKTADILASARTKRHMAEGASTASSMADPWAGGNDPWSQYRQPGPPPGLEKVQPSMEVDSQESAKPLVTKKLQQVEDKLRANMEQAVKQQFEQHKADAQDQPGHEQERRMQKLEVGLAELQQQNTKFEGWFQSFGTQVDQNAQELKGLQSAVQHQQAELVAVQDQVATQGQQVQQTVAQAVQVLQQDMTTQLSTQLGAQLEHMKLLFRGRGECERILDRLRHCARTALGQDVQITWPEAIYESGRVQIVRNAVGDMPLICANVYGFARGQTHEAALQQTNDLLVPLTKELVLGRKGPRIIGGDFNHDAESLQCTHIWRNQGWCEAQELRLQRWQIPLEPTCKGATRRDFLWLSPEAVALCTGVSVEHHFAEHATLSAVLQVPDKGRSITTWPRPQELPWHEIDVEAWHAADVHHAPAVQSNLTDWYAQFSNAWERSLSSHVPAAPSQGPPRTALGRAQRLQPSVGQTQPSLPKPSREGEVQMANQLLGRQTKQWFQQLRRLQSLRDALRAASQSHNAVEYRATLWRSILKAKGFEANFSLWWSRRPVQLQGTPSCLPYAPTVVQMELIFQDFHANYKSFESWQIRQRSRVLAAKHEECLTKLYTELRHEKTAPLDTLTITRTYEVLEVDEVSSQFAIEGHLDNRGYSEWQSMGLPIHVVSTDGPVGTVEGPLPAPGSELEQKQFLYLSEHVLFELESLWRPRWCKGVLPSSSDWERVAAFTEHFLPHASFQIPPISVQMWRRAVRRLKTRAARGPDAYSREDLLQMPTARVEQLLDALRLVEAGQPWPQQLLHGFVCSTHKGKGREGPDAYRPICLFSIVFRVWASIRAKQVLAHLEKYMPHEAFGYLPGREAADLWFLLQAQIECCLQTGETMVGYCGDLVKAFNGLPRFPIFKAAAQIGVPQEVMAPWSAFNAGVQRHFLVRNVVGQAIPSTSGLVEGDPMSVVGMTVADFMFHVYMRHFAPRVCALSYVDNLMTTAFDLLTLARGRFFLECFWDMLGLELDDDKAYHWALKAEDRRNMQSLGLRVLRHERELGGFFSFGSQAFVKDLVHRLQSLSPLWTHLARSAAPGWRKLQALPSKFWSRALHGAVGCVFSEAHLNALRAKASRALGYNKAGSSSQIALFLSSTPEADPGYYNVWRTISDFRRLLVKDPVLIELWRSFMSDFDGRFRAGPFSKLLQVADRLHWAFHDPPLFLDHFGAVHDLLLVSTSSLRFLVKDAWAQHVLAGHAHRETMQDIRTVDTGLVFESLRGLNSLEGQWQRNIRSGTAITPAQQSKFDLTQPAQCTLCYCTDNVAHRVLHCPRFAECRVDYGWVVEQASFLPKALVCHLLPPRHADFSLLRVMLENLPDQSRSYYVERPPAPYVKLFTDGSGLYQDLPGLELAAWAVQCPDIGGPLASGPVCGADQSVPRAELTAAVCALTWAAREPVCVGLWSDAMYVVEGLRHLQQGHPIRSTVQHRDLWDEAESLVQQLADRLTVNHVKAHEDLAEAPGPYEAWCFEWNAAADTAAGLANANRPQAFHQLHAALLHDRACQKSRLQALQGIHFRIASMTNQDRLVVRESGDMEFEEAVLQPPTAEHVDGFSDNFAPNWRQAVRRREAGRSACSALLSSVALDDCG
ncbi:LINE-1 reverse transcriptase-like [Symbiodinium microadriaticum]|uniref:LINE-1 reverse transcriptase-like n=1 Tax=Symbiodinium microadriaticum TaxID=2951 RepID=A0A1Q9D215_SYMMI|nr:LINE-1 reverse transcriptase-like [Symbiodinium microadriaticum]